MAVIAVFVLTVTATIPVSIAQVASEQEQETGEIDSDFCVDVGNQGGNTTSEPLSFGNNTQGNTTYSFDDEEEN